MARMEAPRVFLALLPSLVVAGPASAQQWLDREDSVPLLAYTPPPLVTWLAITSPSESAGWPRGTELPVLQTTGGELTLSRAQ